MEHATSLAAGVFRWSNPYLAQGYIVERQSGYHPEIASCGIDTTCNGACGNGFVACKANTDLALFYYNPSDGQTCCNSGDGRACDAGYYCARDLSGTTWCCENQYNNAQCASIYQLSTLLTGPSLASAASTTSSATHTPEPSLTSSGLSSTITTSAAITQHNISAITSTAGYLNSNFTYTPSLAAFTGAAPPGSVSLKRVAVLGILVLALSGV